MFKLSNIKSMMLHTYWDFYVIKFYNKNRESCHSFIIYINCFIYEFFFTLRLSHVK